VREIETDYLVVGAGAAGMAFTDALIDACDADVVLVDRRHAPGGHWNDAYPFVRLHGPSALYGVNSRRLGSDVIEQDGPNAGFYPRATAAEICAYFRQVLDEVLLGSGRVRFFGMSDCPITGGRGTAGGTVTAGGAHEFTSLLTGETTTVRVRKRVVDARYLEPSIPATQVTPYSVEPGARLIPVNDLVRVSEPADGYTVIGGGKTAIDACLWLLESGVPADAIRWIRPRDPWLLDRTYQQPLALLPRLMEGVSLYLEAAAQAQDAADLFRRLEACGQLVRLDPEVEPSTFRCATVSQDELARLRSIGDVIRLGRVTRLGPDRIDLAGGSVPTGPGQVHVDCSAAGLRTRPARPVFSGNVITLQQFRSCQPVFSAALAGYVEAARDDEAQKNQICPANRYPDAATDWIPLTCTAQRAEITWVTDPDVSAWMQRSRLNASRGVGDHRDDPVMQSALGRLFTNIEPAISNLERLTPRAHAAAD
jgi:NAD(P)-binding Rossmann-like domain